MAKIRWVSERQILAARIAVRLAREDGREPDAVLVKIAEAGPPPPGVEPPTDDDANESDRRAS